MKMQPTMLQAWPRLRAVLDLLTAAIFYGYLGMGFALALLLIVGEVMR